MATVVEMAEWAETPGRWHGELQGTRLGAGISLIFNSSERHGGGPRLHRHPYPETFIVQAGRAVFTIGEAEIEAVAGQLLVVPANTPHRFRIVGPERFDSIDIHASASFITEWLE